MNPQLYQSIKLMELPSLDLREKIEEELEQNPALEMLIDKTTVPLNEAKRQFIKRSGDQQHSGSSSSNNYQGFMEGTLTRAETLQEHLLWYLYLEPIDNELRKIAETLIQNLDDDGFFIIKDLDKLFEGLSEAPPSAPLIEKALKLIRGLDPAGCAAADYKESLKIQIELLQDDLPVDILIDNLDLIEKEKYSLLAKKTNFDEEDIREICELIKSLSPFPGRAFSAAKTRYVIPDIKVTREVSEDGQDELIINLNDEAFPVLGISKFYEKLTDTNDKKNSPDYKAAREFAQKNIKEAQLFIDHLKRRNQTLIRTANAILQFQRAFFLNGPKYLAPLTLKDIAKELNVHETTVSRAANGKYMQTEWGIFEIRYFFTNSISGTGKDRSEFSKKSVKEIIKEIVAESTALLSDQEISAILAQKGIALARRTVAKYRKELDMGSSYTRKIIGGTK